MFRSFIPLTDRLWVPFFWGLSQQQNSRNSGHFIVQGPNAKNNGAFVRLSVLKVRVAHNRAGTTASLCAQLTGQLKFLWVLFCFGSLVCPADVFEPVSWCVRLLPSNPFLWLQWGKKKLFTFGPYTVMSMMKKAASPWRARHLCFIGGRVFASSRGCIAKEHGENNRVRSTNVAYVAMVRRGF